MRDATRELVVAEARLWLGTPYHHSARVRGVGVDCAMLPAAVYEEVGLIDHIDAEYTRDWHLHRSEEKYIEWVLHAGGREIEFSEARPGDLLLWRWGRTFSHGGILVSETEVVHSWLGLGVTIDDITTHEELKNRPMRCFTLEDR